MSTNTVISPSNGSQQVGKFLTYAEFEALWKDRPGFTQEEQLSVIDQASVLLEQVYVHLQQKQAMYAVNPLQRLMLLRDKIQSQAARDKAYAEIDFHRDMVKIFNSLHDGHTCYMLPSPFNNFAAVLPFLI